MALHVVVCIKAVVTKVPVKTYVRTAGSLELNPFDRPVLETALRLREIHGGKVTALTMGPEAGLSALYEAQAMGVDQTVLVCDAALAGSDTLATAKALGAAVKKLMPFDLLLFGTRSSDSDTGQVGPQTAARLGLPLVTGVHAVACENGNATVTRRADGFLEEYLVPLPGVFTIDPTSVRPRDLKLSRLESAFEQRAEQRWALSDLGLAPGEVGWAGSPTKVPSVQRVVKEKGCTFISGSAEEQVDQLVDQIKARGVID